MSLFDKIPVKLTNVSKSYSFNNQSCEVLHNISLHVNSGELLLLLGPSGSGKTTLLTIIAGLIPPSTGEVQLFDNNIIAYSKDEFQKMLAHKIGFVFQTFNLIDSLTSIENIALSAQFANLNKTVAYHDLVFSTHIFTLGDCV